MPSTIIGENADHHAMQIMKSDEDVRMISAEAPVLFAKVRLDKGTVPHMGWILHDEDYAGLIVDACKVKRAPNFRRVRCSSLSLHYGHGTPPRRTKEGRSSARMWLRPSLGLTYLTSWCEDGCCLWGKYAYLSLSRGTSPMRAHRGGLFSSINIILHGKQMGVSSD